MESRTLPGEISRTDQEKDCAAHGKAALADSARVSLGGAARVASRRGSGRRKGRRGREGEGSELLLPARLLLRGVVSV